MGFPLLVMTISWCVVLTCSSSLSAMFLTAPAWMFNYLSMAKNTEFMGICSRFGWETDRREESDNEAFKEQSDDMGDARLMDINGRRIGVRRK